MLEQDFNAVICREMISVVRNVFEARGLVIDVSNARKCNRKDILLEDEKHKMEVHVECLKGIVMQ